LLAKRKIWGITAHKHYFLIHAKILPYERMRMPRYFPSTGRNMADFQGLQDALHHLWCTNALLLTYRLRKRFKVFDMLTTFIMVE